jgi:hypothetical protein
MQGAGLYQEGTPASKMSDQDIVEFIFFPVVNEGCRVIDEGAASCPAIGCKWLPPLRMCMALHGQLAMIPGMGFVEPNLPWSTACCSSSGCCRHACPLRCPALPCCPPHVPGWLALLTLLPRRPCRHCGQGC